jgi:hypothetical protein
MHLVWQRAVVGPGHRVPQVARVLPRNARDDDLGEAGGDLAQQRISLCGGH